MRRRQRREPDGLRLADISRPVTFRWRADSVDDFLRQVAEARDPGRSEEFLRPDPPLVNLLQRHPCCVRAVDRLRRAVRNREHVLLYSDYDCDGVVALTILKELLLAMGLPLNRLTWLIPHRIHDGYGLSLALLRKHYRGLAAKCRPGLVVTLDCGSAASKEVAWLIGQSADVLVVDHHQVFQDSSAHANPRVIHLNPWAFDAPPRHQARITRLRQMCAAGLTWLLARAALPPNSKAAARRRDRFTLLAGLATVADVVPLLGGNRALVKRSLALANDAEALAQLCPGLAALQVKYAKGLTQTDASITEKTYAFAWGPRINAAGRMETASHALELLAARTSEAVKAAANRLTNLNEWRIGTQDAISNSAREMAEQVMQARQPQILLLCDPSWHPGVIGIVAARIREEFNVPAILCAMNAAGDWQGSGRSVPGCDLGVLFQRAHAAGLILRGGGHAAAGGLTFQASNKEALEFWLNNEVGKTLPPPAKSMEADVSATTFSPKEWGEVLSSLAPFGNGNPAPDLVLEGAVLTELRPVPRKESKQREVFAFQACLQVPGRHQNIRVSWLDLERAAAWWAAEWTSRREASTAQTLGDKVKYRLALEVYVSGSSPAGTERSPGADSQGARRHYFHVRDCWRLHESAVEPKGW
ncbi:MAG: DHHA1 domain-containing protein [Limisphaerales bacterium]